MSADFEAELEDLTKEIKSIDATIERLMIKKQSLIAQKSIINRRITEKASEELANRDWERYDHPWSNKVKEVLKSKFKIDKFRPHQLSTINAVMSGQDCILLMPTGGGKSLCYQLPAMVLKGITLVVSPLVSLMEDQIMAMEALNLPATLLNASSTREHVNHVQKEMTSKEPSIKLLYVTPEKLAKSKRFMSKLEKMYQMGQFSLLAIDEVHCCSQWGHDFRPDYKFLGIMKRQFPKVPILGLTATASSSIIQDIQSMLSLKGCLVLRATFNRPNLKYEVTCKSSCQKDNISELEDLLKNRFNGVSGIIYCFSVKDCEEIASELRKRGVKAKPYHAQLDAKSRSFVHKCWTSNTIQVIVATVAFGMGIDKPDVRFVIHHSLPKSMENFYQESGRAGRDDQPASCILFYRFADVFRQSTMVFTEQQKGLENLYGMVAYCLDLTRCRRSLIAQHFDERWDMMDCNKMCDHCEQKGLYEEKLKNIAREYRAIVNILEHASMIEERLTNQKLIEAWQGKGPPKLRPPGQNSTTLSRETCERIIALLLLESYLKEEFHFTPYSTISYFNIGPKRHPNDQELLFPMSMVRVKNNIDNNGTSSIKNNKLSETSKISTKESSSSKQQQTKKSSSTTSTAASSSSTKEKNSIKIQNVFTLKVKEGPNALNDVTSKQNSETSSTKIPKDNLKVKNKPQVLNDVTSKQKPETSTKIPKDNIKVKKKPQVLNEVTSKQNPETSCSTNILFAKKRSKTCILSSDDDDDIEVERTKKQKVDNKILDTAVTICDESSKDEMEFEDYDIFIYKNKNSEKKKVTTIVVSDSD